ncbi:MAG: TM2 domain-containing protein [Erythrobacter sp.]|uniref:TM2 domain-containing protein n=1 Tax=Erythrobacter sp. TaxID=1042 RepID=UPI00262FD381|nr:TM2 domain-containing protein [Erythrobacter sp.]MDJ0976905.1 TM2 domain-containing protein [Erythrobacter sp.]
MHDDRFKDAFFEANRKSKAIAYLLWFFFGWFGVHRFYAGETKTGIIQLLLSLSIIGLPVMLFWLLLDIVLIPGLINEKNLELLHALNRGDGPGVATEGRDTRDDGLLADPKRQRMLEDLRAAGYRKEPRDRSFLYR